MAKPILTLKRNRQAPTQAPAPTPELKQPIEDVVNPLTIVEVVSWDYTPEEEFAPRQRKRRKDKEVEQYRKESKWQ